MWNVTSSFRWKIICIQDNCIFDISFTPNIEFVRIVCSVYRRLIRLLFSEILQLQYEILNHKTVYITEQVYLLFRVDNIRSRFITKRIFALIKTEHWQPNIELQCSKMGKMVRTLRESVFKQVIAESHVCSSISLMTLHLIKFQKKFDVYLYTWRKKPTIFIICYTMRIMI